MKSTFRNEELLPRDGLIKKLKNADPIVRHEALWDLIHRHKTGEIPEFWELLDNDCDDDVVVLLASHLSSMRRGSADKTVYWRIFSALKRFDPGEAKAEILEDVFLYIFKNMTTRDIVLMNREEKNQILEEAAHLQESELHKPTIAQEKRASEKTGENGDRYN